MRRHNTGKRTRRELTAEDRLRRVKREFGRGSHEYWLAVQDVLYEKMAREEDEERLQLMRQLRTA